MSAGFTTIFGESIRMTRYEPTNWLLAGANVAYHTPCADQRRCTVDNRSTIPRFRIRDTRMGPGKSAQSVSLPVPSLMLHVNPGLGQPRRARRERSGTQYRIF
jgi:hypothetical protein